MTGEFSDTPEISTITLLEIPKHNITLTNSQSRINIHQQATLTTILTIKTH